MEGFKSPTGEVWLYSRVILHGDNCRYARSPHEMWLQCHSTFFCLCREPTYNWGLGKQ